MKFTKKEIAVLQGQGIINVIMSFAEDDDFGYNLSEKEAQDLVDKLESLKSQ